MLFGLKDIDGTQFECEVPNKEAAREFFAVKGVTFNGDVFEINGETPNG